VKLWFHKLLLRFWPWKDIDRLEKSLAQVRKDVVYAYERGHYSGVRWHLEQWMKQSNMYYGNECFNDGQEKLMMRLYQDGLTYREALDHLRLAEGRDIFYSRTGFDGRKDFQND
jgi:hypothetical protein